MTNATQRGPGPAPEPPVSREILQLKGVSKRFPGVVALDGIDLDLCTGEVHAVCGENGAGKSTLMKIISGQYRADEGVVRYRGAPVQFSSTSDAQAAGIAIIHQELNLVPHLSVAENIYLAREPKRGPFVDYRTLNSNAQRCLQRIGLNVSPNTLVGALSLAQQQMVEIAKALSLDARVLIMDEPTSSLTESETVQLFRIIRELRAGGVAILYISHRLDEMAEIVDRVTVLRDGRHIATSDFASTTVNEIVARMVGRPLDDAYPPRQSTPSNQILLRVRDLQRAGVFGPLSFELRKGEILGFAGLMGAGRTETARAIFGAERPDSGSIMLGDEPVAISSPREAIRHGIAYLSEDRKKDGLALSMPVSSNITLANVRAILVARLSAFLRRDGHRRALRSRTRHPYTDGQADRKKSVRWQSTEDRHQQMAVSRLAHSVFRRADPRHRRRREVRDLRADGQTGGGRRRCRPDQFGAARIAWHD